MSEMNEFVPTTDTMEPETGTNLPDIPGATSGTEAVTGMGIGGAVGGFIGSKIGYGKAIADIAKLENKDPKALAAELKAAKKKAKGPKGKLGFRNPFYRKPVEVEEPAKTAS